MNFSIFLYNFNCVVITLDFNFYLVKFIKNLQIDGMWLYFTLKIVDVSYFPNPILGRNKERAQKVKLFERGKCWAIPKILGNYNHILSKFNLNRFLVNLTQNFKKLDKKKFSQLITQNYSVDIWFIKEVFNSSLVRTRKNHLGRGSCPIYSFWDKIFKNNTTIMIFLISIFSFLLLLYLIILYIINCFLIKWILLFLLQPV